MRKAIVLGGYGLIGSAAMRALREAGFHVVGMGRSRASADVADASGEWIIRDIARVETGEWRSILSGVDVLVNAAGALQDGARDDLEAIHVTAVERIVEAAADLPVRLVQISAVGAVATAGTEFLASKARGDAIVAESANDWVILRPALVLSHDAYGGTALLRAIASMPAILPRVLPDAEIQTVHAGDVAAAIVAAAQGRVPSGTIADLAEPDAHGLFELTLALRRWQGRPPPIMTPRLPSPLLALAGRGADLLGHLGWRSPLRTTALRSLADGVRGDPGVWQAVGGPPCRSLEQTLALLPATRQERLFAHAYLALPLLVGTLALFWIVSGLVAMLDVGRAVSLLTERGVSDGFARFAVVGGAVADMAVGLAILWRAWARRAALAMVGLCLAYLFGSLVVAPDLWLDPLGPMIKVFPALTLCVIAWLLLEER